MRNVAPLRHQAVSSSARTSGMMRSLAAAGLVLLLLPFAGCAGSGGAGTTASPAPAGPAALVADIDGVYNECVALCMENTSQALVTRTGCLEGCAEMRRISPLAKQTFDSGIECAQTVDAMLRETGATRRTLNAWCDAAWTETHNRMGCRHAVDAFFTRMTPVRLCGVAAPPSAPSAPSVSAVPDSAASPSLRDTPKYRTEPGKRATKPTPRPVQKNEGKPVQTVTPAPSPKATPPATPVQAAPQTPAMQPGQPGQQPPATAPAVKTPAPQPQPALVPQPSGNTPRVAAPGVPASAPGPLPRLTVPSSGPRGPYSTSGSMPPSGASPLTEPSGRNASGMAAQSTAPSASPPSHTGAPPTVTPDTAVPPAASLLRQPANNQ